MGYLTITCREGEEIRLSIDPGVDGQLLLQQLLRDGITIHVGELGGSQVRISIEAPKQIQIMRSELE